MRDNGFGEEAILRVYGYTPPVLTPDQFAEAFAKDLAAATSGWRRFGA